MRISALATCIVAIIVISILSTLLTAVEPWLGSGRMDPLTAGALATGHFQILLAEVPLWQAYPGIPPLRLILYPLAAAIIAPWAFGSVWLVKIRWRRSWLEAGWAVALGGWIPYGVGILMLRHNSNFEVIAPWAVTVINGWIYCLALCAAGSALQLFQTPRRQASAEIVLAPRIVEYPL